MVPKPFKKRFPVVTTDESCSESAGEISASINNRGRLSRTAKDHESAQKRYPFDLKLRRNQEQIHKIAAAQIKKMREEARNSSIPKERRQLRTRNNSGSNAIHKINLRSSSDEAPNDKGRSITMRVGRKPRKTVVEPKKTKPCFVRLEKVPEEKPESKEREREHTPINRKLTGPLKKRPLNPSPSAKKIDHTPTTVASTRTRRAPKPNPKYANADIIIPKAKAQRGRGHRGNDDASADDSDSAEDFYNDLDETSNGSEINDLDGTDVFEVESSDFSETEKSRVRTRRSPKTPSPAVQAQTAKRGRPRTRCSPLPTNRPGEPKKSTQLQVSSQRGTPTPGSHQSQQNRKRKVDDVGNNDEPPESIIARNKRLNIALYDSNVAKPVQISKSITSKVGHTAGNSRAQSPLTTGTSAAHKRLIQGQNPIRSSSSAGREERIKSSLHKKPSASGSRFTGKSDSATTQDDFETMPTFTIVNINDIINKKGDSLVQKSAEDSKSPTTSPVSMNRVNRRKSGHTTILSEKIDPNKARTALSRPPIPLKKLTVLNSNSTPRPELRQQTRTPLQIDRKPVTATSAVDKPAPRILNSVVAKRTYPVQPILGKLDNDIDLDPSEDSSEKTKENLGANKVLPLKSNQPRKLPPEKVFIQRQGTKLIKKITCFETWYVINIPETQEPIVKNVLDIPLITLSNAAKTIRLPSSAWSTKVTLYKLSAQMIGKSNLVPYTGDLSDQNIAEEDREKYQPSCVMFRRMTQQKSRTRMPYDRAVIFKMKTFFTNIDGKNVRLIGAPSTINSFDEIEVLLELVDDLDLNNEFVEPASTV